MHVGTSKTIKVKVQTNFSTQGQGHSIETSPEDESHVGIFLVLKYYYASVCS